MSKKDLPEGIKTHIFCFCTFFIATTSFIKLYLKNDNSLQVDIILFGVSVITMFVAILSLVQIILKIKRDE